MTTPTKVSASDILNAATQAVWEKIGNQASKQPEITPEKIRKWMPKVEDETLFKRFSDIHRLENMPKDREPEHWMDKMYYRIVRCQSQHEIDVPIKTSKVKIKTTKPPEIDFPTTVLITQNPAEIRPRTLMNSAVSAILKCCDPTTTIPDFHTDQGTGQHWFILVKTEEISISTLEDGIIAIHKLWDIVNQKHKNAFYHPIEPIVEAYIKEVNAKHITEEYNKKYPITIMDSKSMGSIRDVILPPSGNRIEELSELKGISTPAPNSLQLKLPISEEFSILPAVLPLQAIHIVEGIETTKRGAVAMPIRIFFEALMALQPKETEVDIHFTLGDLLGYLNPNAKYHRKNHLPYVIEGCA